MEANLANHVFRRLVPQALLLFAACCLSGCDMGFITLAAGEYGAVFSALPPWAGGGVSNKVIVPGEMSLILPWQSVYRLDTTVQTIEWGGAGHGDRPDVEDYVETRALDGNEVGLSVTVQYHVSPDKVPYVVQRVGTSNEKIRHVVEAVARADIRTHMNILKTRDFFDRDKRQAAVEQVKKALTARLASEGIVVDDAIYKDHKFERRLPDGTVDRSYQEQLDRTQALKQETEQEAKKLAAVVEKKGQELNDTQAQVNRVVEEARGYKEQRRLAGDGYLQTRRNEADQILAVGMAEVEGMKKKIEALSGPGGEALLRLAIVKALMERDPRFVLVNSASDGKGGLDLSKIDTNELIRQAGIFAAAQEAVADSPPKKEQQALESLR